LRGAGAPGNYFRCAAPPLASGRRHTGFPAAAEVGDFLRLDEKVEGTVMTFTDRAPRRSAQPEEWFSILLALVATVGASIFIGYNPDYKPATEAGGGVAWAVPVWIGFFYLIIQMTFLLFSASQIRALGVLDSVLAIAPVVAGLVLLIQTIISPTFHLSSYQLNSLAVLIVAGASEFLLTIWIRFVINRRTIGFGADT
jgi:hypothetical protein